VFVAPDTALASLYESASRLGVAGAADVYTALAPGRSSLPTAQVPPGISMSFAPPNFLLRADDATWAVCFPFYFMPVPLGRQVPANGVATELSVLSTLFAPDSGEAGASQATIFIAAAAPRDSAQHVGFWLRQLAVVPAPGAAIDTSGEWYSTPAPEQMRRVVVVRRLPERVVILAYAGVAGTYEVNLPHFRDLLRTLRPGRCAA
jgi:hypothetical protein